MPAGGLDCDAKTLVEVMNGYDQTTCSGQWIAESLPVRRWLECRCAALFGPRLTCRLSVAYFPPPANKVETGTSCRSLPTTQVHQPNLHIHQEFCSIWLFSSPSFMRRVQREQQTSNPFVSVASLHLTLLTWTSSPLRCSSPSRLPARNKSPFSIVVNCRIDS